MLAELSQTIGFCIAVVKSAIIVSILRIASSLPFTKKQVQRYEERHLLVPYQNFWDEYAGKKMFAAIVRILTGDYNKTARLGSCAPNCNLVTADGEACRLLDFARGKRPLVVNFGSCS